jgi:hypothetical protein
VQVPLVQPSAVASQLVALQAPPGGPQLVALRGTQPPPALAQLVESQTQLAPLHT